MVNYLDLPDRVLYILTDLPDRVLYILSVESNEEAHDGEEHHGISGHHQATGATLNHCGGGGVGDGGHGGGGGQVRRSRGRVRCDNCDRSPGQDDGQGKGRDDNAGAEEPGQLPAGVAGGVLTVPLGYEGGDGGEEVEDDHSEGVPVVELWQGTGQEQEQETNRASEGQSNQSLDPSHFHPGV